MNAQTYVNKEWHRTTGIPDGTDWTATTLDADKNLIFVGNTVVAPNNANVLVTKYNTEGGIIWQRTMSGSAGGNDYGVAVTTDNQNNVYVAAAVTVSNGLFDFALIKYNADGVMQWTSTWDNGLHDIPTAIALDDVGNIIVAGATTSFTQQVNYAVVKWNTEGSLQWATQYDFAGLSDFPTAIEKVSNDNIVVTGASANAANSWDYATLLLNGSTGQIMNVNRVTVPEVGLDKPLAVTRDAQNNIFITGYNERNGNKNIQTVKLNSSFGLEWVKNFDGAGLEDIAKAIDVDGFGNVYVAGHTKTVQDGDYCIVLKYDTNGNEIWQRSYKPQDYEKAEAADIKVMPSGEVYVSGQIQQGNAKDFATLKYTQNGDLAWEKKYDGKGSDQPKSVEADAEGNIYVSGISETTTGNTYETVKYEEWKRERSVVLDSYGQPSHIAGQLIVEFAPSQVKLDFVNNPEVYFGECTEALQNTMIDAMQQVLPFNIRNNPNIRLTKVYPFLTTADSFATSRLGEQVRMPILWSNFLLEIPEEADLVAAKTALNNLFPKIHFCELNGLAKLESAPNDSFFRKQHSLISSAYPKAHINVDSAWNITTGKSDIKVGVYDMPIDWKHPDFGGKDFSKSVIKGGIEYEYLRTINFLDTIKPSTISLNHGTNVAGIIGAMRNNNIGVAGIAGGDILRRDTGVSLYSMGIFRLSDGHSLPISTISSAIVFGTQNYGLNIENHSWSFEDESLELRKAVRTAFALNTVLVASRGNQGVFEARYPACFNDDWVISVGGSANRDTINGLVGAFKTRYNGDFWWQSNYGRGVDIVAPSSMYTKPQIGSFTSRDSVSIFTTNPRGFPAKDSLMNSDYTGFNGTSAAAPHVSGVAALMLSLHNNKRGYPNNLAPEDVEFILQKYATDIVGTGLIDSFVRDTAEKYVLRPNDTTRVTYPVGYDDYNGWGRLNAGASLRMIDTPRYQILHPTDAPTSFSKTLVRSNANIALLDKVNNVDAGNYVADVYRAQEQYTYNTLTNWRIVDAWRRVSSSKGYADTINIRDEPWLNFNATINASRNQVNVTASSYFYKIGTNWVPFHPDSIKKFRYSVHLENLNATDAQEVTKTIKKFNVFPNPTSGRITIDYQLEQMPSNLHVEIFDVAGRLVQRSEMPQLLNATFTLDIPNLAQGIYVVRLTADGDSLYKKLIKL